MKKVAVWIPLIVISCSFMEKLKAINFRFPFHILKQHIFEVSPKNWLSYVQAFLYQNIKICCCHSHHCNSLSKSKTKIKVLVKKILTETFLLFTQKSKVFLQKSRGIIVHVPQKMFDPGRNINKYSHLKHIEQIQQRDTCEGKFKHWKICRISSPTKNILSESTSSFYLVFQYRLGVSLDTLLQLNVTFFALQMPEKRCTLSYVFVTQCQHKDFQSKCRSCSPKKNCGQLYCGIHSLFTFVSKESVVIMKRKVQSSPHFTNLSFCVVDGNRMHTVVTSRKFKFSPEKYQLFQRNRDCLGMLYFSTSKLQRLRLQFQETAPQHIVVFDGPGTLSHKIKPTKKNNRVIYYTSTFQCFVHLFMKNVPSCLEYKFADLTLQYISNLLNIRQVDIHPNSILLLTYFKQINWSQNHNIHLIKCVSSSGEYLNLTLNSLHYEGETSTHCSYGGMSIHDPYLGKPAKELRTICQWKRKSVAQRNVYSESSEMFLVLYSYPHYAHINISLSLSVTPCQIFKANPCLTMSKEIPYQRLFDPTYEGHEAFKVEHGGCVVVQVTPNYISNETLYKYINKFARCYYSVKPKDILYAGQSISFHMKGHFATYFHPPLLRIDLIYGPQRWNQNGELCACHNSPSQFPMILFLNLKLVVIPTVKQKCEIYNWLLLENHF